MILELENVGKSFPHPSGNEKVEVLRNLQLQVNQGETVAVLGQSGSGKSTLLSLLAGLDQPTSGALRIRGTDLAQMSEEELTRFRAENIGIIFQQFHLMSHLTALENVSLPLEIFQRDGHVERSRKALEQVRLEHRHDHFPYQLSGGECQRVAIARAVVVEPAILLADEPTGSLDHENTKIVFNSIRKLSKEHKIITVFATHNLNLVKLLDKCFLMEGGKLIDYKNK